MLSPNLKLCHHEKPWAWLNGLQISSIETSRARMLHHECDALANYRVLGGPIVLQCSVHVRIQMTSCKSKTCATGRQHSFPEPITLVLVSHLQRASSTDGVSRVQLHQRACLWNEAIHGATLRSQIQIIGQIFTNISHLTFPSSNLIFDPIQPHTYICPIKNATHRLDHHHCFPSTHLCIGSSLAVQETSVPGSWEHRPAL